jgi:hypothetical protein
MIIGKITVWYFLILASFDTAWRILDLGIEGQPPDLEGGCEQAVTDK